MGSNLKVKKLRIGGMTCVNCQNKIEKKLQSTAGIQKVEVSYRTGTAVVSYDPDIISFSSLTSILERLGYSIASEQDGPMSGMRRIVGLLLVIVAIYMMMEHFGLLNFLVPDRLAESSMGYTMLFMVGLLTSVHCIAMCGGINLSQCIPQTTSLASASRFSTLLPASLYNLGRVLSYTAVGFLVGALGSAITFSATSQGILKLIAGVFMIMMGINMLGIVPWFRWLHIRVPRVFAQNPNAQGSGSKSPLIVGLLNGLMPCGPLQAMQLYALSTGSAASGALAMFLFSLGTVPLPLGIGVLGSVLGRKFTSKAMTVGAILVAALGLSIFSQGLALSGFAGSMPGGSSGGLPGIQKSEANGDVTVIENGVQVVNSTLSARAYPAITVQAGIPVKWIIDAPQSSINGCNDTFMIPEYGIQHSFMPGENIIEFTPDKSGTFQYSCWMGMIRSTITVTGSEGDSQMPTAQTSGSPDGDPSAVRAQDGQPQGASCCQM